MTSKANRAETVPGPPAISIPTSTASRTSRWEAPEAAACSMCHCMQDSQSVATEIPTAMSSLWEGLPIAFLESMSAGKPIVANNVDGACDVVRDGETGFLVTPHNPLEMADRILALLNDEELCKKMGAIAQERSSFYSKQRMLDHHEVLYEELYNASKVMV